MKKTFLILMSLTMFLFSLTGAAFAASDILVEAATLNVVPSGTTASAFMVITNNGEADDALESCSFKSSPSARCEVHTVEEGKMFQIEKIDLKSGETVLLKKGSYHLMIFDIPEVPSSPAELVLNFKNAGAVGAQAVVKKTEGGMGGMGGMKKSGH